VGGRVERLQETFSQEEEWTAETLKASPIGGWFLDATTDQLFVKLPDGSDPCGKLRISDPAHEKAWLFADGSDVWVEGIVFEHWLRTLTPKPIRAWELGSCAIFQRCQAVMIRDCESRYAIDYAFHFYACTDYVVEDCDFIDGQSYTTYITMRVGLARFGGTVRNYNSALGTVRHNRWHQCFVANQFVSSPNSATEHIEFHHNIVRQARNIPVALTGNGGHHAIWANRFDTCGLAMPNVEQGAPISPTYWINNLAVDAGYFGVFLDDETNRVIKGNRFGGVQSPRIGQYFFYYNTLRTEWFPPNGAGAETIQRINAWQASGKDHSASRYINNILTSRFEEIGVSHANARAIWFHEGADTESNPDLHLVNLTHMRWDFNQYFWNRTDPNGAPSDKDAFCIGLSGLNFTFAEMQTWVKENAQQDWEEHGAFRDPQFDAQSRPTNAIAAKAVAGVTGNAVLEEPGSVSGATIRRY
ncbi:MAG: hypothetical protein KDE31_36180, partial [Caldilineaceae bacterium]|nr:hypothetical protein [Caldilineaceae bacterium]